MAEENAGEPGYVSPEDVSDEESDSLHWPGSRDVTEEYEGEEIDTTPEEIDVINGEGQLVRRHIGEHAVPTEEDIALIRKEFGRQQSQEAEHALVVAFAVDVYGSRENVQRTMDEMQRWLVVQMHKPISVVAYGTTDGKNLDTKNGTMTIADLVRAAQRR